MAHHHNTRSTTTTRRHGLFGRRKVHHQKRKATVGDKIAGAMKKLKGTIMHNPGEKVRSWQSTTCPTDSHSLFRDK